MKTVDLNKVLELAINGESSAVDGLLHEWLVEKFNKVHESIMAEDDISQGIEDDQNEIEAEEFFGEAGDEDADDADGEEIVDGDVDAEADADSEDEFADADGATVEVDSEVAAEIVDTIETTEETLARLKAEFAAIAGMDIEATDVDGDVEGEDDVDGIYGVEDEDEDEKFESLEEGLDLEAVADPNLNGSKEIGSAGSKISVNSKSPIAGNSDVAGRVGGEPVEIDAEEHTGYDRETAPVSKALPARKNTEKKSTDFYSPVKAGKATITTSQGAENNTSPISGKRGSGIKGK